MALTDPTGPSFPVMILYAFLIFHMCVACLTNHRFVHANSILQRIQIINRCMVYSPPPYSCIFPSKYPLASCFQMSIICRLL
jgi:hypothetical protein